MSDVQRATPTSTRLPMSERGSRSDRREGPRWAKTSDDDKENIFEGRGGKDQATLDDIEIRKVGSQVQSVADIANAVKAAAVAAELSVAALEDELHVVRDQVQYLQENMEAQVRELVQIEVGKQEATSGNGRRWNRSSKDDKKDGWENYHNTSDSEGRDEKMAREATVTGFERNSSRQEIQSALERMLKSWGGSEEAAFAPRAVGSLGIIRFHSKNEKRQFKDWSEQQDLRIGEGTLTVRHSESREQRAQGKALAKAKRALIEKGYAMKDDVHINKGKVGAGAVYVKKERVCKWNGEVMTWRSQMTAEVKDRYDELMEVTRWDATDSLSE